MYNIYMDLLLNGNIIEKALIKNDKGEIRYKIIENLSNPQKPVYGLLKTHLENTSDDEVLDYFDYKSKDDAMNEVENACAAAEKAGGQVTRETLTTAQPEKKHYVFSDESHAITYEDDYETIEEAQAFNDLLIKQFGKKFTFIESK